MIIPAYDSPCDNPIWYGSDRHENMAKCDEHLKQGHTQNETAQKLLQVPTKVDAENVHSN